MKPVCFTVAENMKSQIRSLEAEWQIREITALLSNGK